MGRRSSRILLALCSGGLWYAALGLHPLWWPAWLAPVPVLLAAYGAGPVQAFALGALAGLIGSTSLAPYYWAIAGAAPSITICTLQTIIAGCSVLAAASAVRRWPSVGAVWVYPAVLGAIDFLTAASSPHGSGGSLAYTQMNFLPALQVGSWGGSAAVVFLFALAASALSILALHGRGGLPGAAAGLAVVGCLLAWGTWRAGGAQNTAGEVKVALLATDKFAGMPRNWDQVAASYLPAIDAAMAAGASFVVLPEKIVALGPSDLAAASTTLAAKAKHGNATIVIGVLATGDRAWNRALVALPDGQMLTYDKQHLVPGWEARLTPGNGALILPPTLGKIGVAICKDMDFPALGRNYGAAGVQLMLVPGWDFTGAWGEDGWLHGRMAMLRSVEDGFALVRSARQGRLTVNDRTGRVRAESVTGDALVSLVATVPLAGNGPTIYARIGDLFGMACTAVTVLVVGLLARDWLYAWRLRGRTTKKT